MHHFIYPSQDTFVTNTINYPNVNFGLDEILCIGTENTIARFTSDIRTFTYTNVTASNLCVGNFSGTIISGSLYGLSTYITGSITGGTGSVVGVGFSGSSVITGSTFSGSINGFNGTINGFVGRIVSGVITGHYDVSQSYQSAQTKTYVNRALVKFNLTSISKSIASGDIRSPEFKLILKVSKEENLPIEYSIYAYPISQSWIMGNGYSSDGGSTTGASWNYRDFYSGSVWTYVTDPNGLTPIDFITDPSLTSLVWARGGGTWYTSAISSQSFNYEAGDINMNVSNIVYAWLSGSIPNEGFILISDEETNPSGSSTALNFFSKDSNTIYQPILDVGWDDTSWVTGSVSTGSVTILSYPIGFIGSITNATLVGSSVTGSFSGITNYSSDANFSASGVMSVTGNSLTIINAPIYGNWSGSITGSTLMGTLYNGIFSGSIFTSSLSVYTLPFGTLTGSWNSQSMVGSSISSSYPFSVYPSTYATIIGPYINGTAFGTYYVSESIGSSSFNGVFVDGLFVGAQITAQISGTFLTSSYSFTSSVVMSSSSLEIVDFNKPFVTVVQNLQPTLKAGNVVRINVFARPEFPFKNFQRRTQFTQYLTPQYLPTSSYYAIKDNETDQIILDFDNYTKVSCDVNGNYFLLDTTGFPQERYFKLLLKTEHGDSIYTFDKGDIFKIVR